MLECPKLAEGLSIEIESKQRYIKYPGFTFNC